MFAIVKTGGKQYRVEEGTRLRVETLPNEKGSQFALGEVLLVSDEGGIQVGSPTVAGVEVTAEVVTHDRHAKVIVFKKRSKKTYKKWIGHRQNYTELVVKSIGAPGSAPKAESTTKAKPKSKAKTSTQE